MTYHHQWLYVLGKDERLYEVFNGARTAAYLAEPPRVASGCRFVSNVLDFGGCEAYAWSPPCDSGLWTPLGFSTPAADNAPWYMPSVSDSADGLGFWIEEWTGLDAGHIRRSYTNMASGGAAAGRAWTGPRVMKFNVLVFGLSERALEHQFRWLEALLLTGCGPCDMESIYIRRFCPEADGFTINPNEGIGILHNVSCVEGPVWEASPTENSGCFMRRLSFTLMAGDPSIYAPDEAVLAATTFDVQVCPTGRPAWPCNGTDGFDAQITDNHYPDCKDVGVNCVFSTTLHPDVVGAATPVVTITNPSSNAEVPRLEIAFYANTAGLSAQDSCSLPLLGALRTKWLPPSSELVYDVARRQIWYKGKSTAGPVQGWPFVEANQPGVPRFFTMGCGEVLMVIRVAANCWSYGGINNGEVPHLPQGVVYWKRVGRFNVNGQWSTQFPVAVAAPKVSVSMVERFG